MRCNLVFWIERRVKRPHSLFLCRRARFLDKCKWHPMSKRLPRRGRVRKASWVQLYPWTTGDGVLGQSLLLSAFPVGEIVAQVASPSKPRRDVMMEASWAVEPGCLEVKPRVLGHVVGTFQFLHQKSKKKKKIVPSSSVCCVRLNYLIPAEHRDQEWDPVPLHTQSVDKHWVKNHGSWDLPVTSWWQECRFSSVVSQGVADGLDPIKSTGPCL